MFRMTQVLAAGAAVVAFAGVGYAQQGGFATVEDVVISETVETTVTTETYMGMSDKAPPNEHAANSQGTRTEETTTTTTTTVTGDVTGPPGQVVNQQNYDCNQCTTANEETTVTIETSTEVTDYPGKN